MEMTFRGRDMSSVVMERAPPRSAVSSAARYETGGDRYERHQLIPLHAHPRLGRVLMVQAQINIEEIV